MHGSLKLFAEIDINGDHHVDWGEFMQFIIDAVMESSIGGNNVKQEGVSLSEMVKMMKVNKFKRFYLSYRCVDKNKH